MPATDTASRCILEPGDRVQVTEGDLMGREGEVVLAGSNEVLVRLAPSEGWPTVNLTGLPPRALRRAQRQTDRAVSPVA